MTLLHTITLNNQDILIYDEIDSDQLIPGKLSTMSPFSGDTTYCGEVQCDECQFNTYSGVSCTQSLPKFIRSSLLPTHPEFFM